MSTWNGNARSDGLIIVQSFEGNWFVLDAGDRPAIDRCPICKKRLETAEEARAAADQAIPQHPALL